MAISRDLLGELIEDLERTLPTDAQSGRYQVLPRLEDLQAVVGVILFASEEERQRLFADPQYQRLHDTVMTQLQHACTRTRDDRGIKTLPIEPVD